MITFPNAKINIGLHIVEKRADGYHNLETVFYPLPVYDVLEFVEAKQKTALHTSGIHIPEGGTNLCLKAFDLLKENFQLPELEIYLHKHIPIGAGLGGGSADAAFFLKSVNDSFGLELTTAQLCAYAARLGADCPFFIENKPVYAYDIGTSFEPVELDLSSYYIVMIKPDIHISTAEAYANVSPQVSDINLKEAVRLQVQEWKFLIGNDFEDGLFERYPLIKSLKEACYESGALYASMSGSGSAVYAIFKEKVNVDHLQQFGKVYYPTIL
ncbi:4-(cytidine 5'-diphospho)-2-C-methyl-D-erythritol kinase [Sphingobacterium spiritivorum]|uniref:4-(cytidine 5'-diphospho)-2-C-methyl-D-erythritol kinase n=1 Tax=Sphingobacterium spiritivorum TaxID=258 RepID=UPI003DA226E8